MTPINNNQMEFINLIEINMEEVPLKYHSHYKIKPAKLAPVVWNEGDMPTTVDSLEKEEYVLEAIGVKFDDKKGYVRCYIKPEDKNKVVALINPLLKVQVDSYIEGIEKVTLFESDNTPSWKKLILRWLNIDIHDDYKRIMYLLRHASDYLDYLIKTKETK